MLISKQEIRIQQFDNFATRFFPVLNHVAVSDVLSRIVSHEGIADDSTSRNEPHLNQHWICSHNIPYA
uniref:AlNc14C119G6606 protein n=1 Tax=Albugo laibachii Nc14 TaxID=890382 RepID=F0WJ74_9STRA|nr:AlNc14C119G6606 [Albugo laibachii Nc14]|eukprot:CCA21321.1 AlNc14C119G6606 [Albugo laibachii Nc14]